MTTCPICGSRNHIVNQCRCDPNNLPTKVPQPDNENAQEILRALGRAPGGHEAELIAVALAAEALHRANQLEMGAVEMNKRFLALENALNAWRAAK